MGWRWLDDDPPPDDMMEFFVGSSTGGRMDWVFRWPGKTGEVCFWCKGSDMNYLLTAYTPDIWHPGPPEIEVTNEDLRDD